MTRICYISTFPPNRCGLAYYTFALVRAINRIAPFSKVYVLGFVDDRSPENTEQNLVFRTLNTRDFTLFSKVFNIVSYSEPDVIHIQHHFALYSSFSLVVLCLLSKMLMKNYRIVITLHELPSIAGEIKRTKKSVLTLEKLVRGLRLSLLLRGLFLFDAVIVHTYQAKQTLVNEYNISPKKIELIPHGSESEVQILPSKVARRMLGLDLKKKIILCFGFIRPYKGYELLLEAVSKISKTTRDEILVFIVGDFHPNSIEIDKEYFRSLCEIVKRLGLDGNVRFDVGFVPEEKIHVYFSSADVVAMPYTDCIASGIFHLAAGYSKPVIASATGELKSLKQDMVALFSPNDVTGLRDTILNIISKSDLERADMGNSLKVFSEKSFSWTVTANKTLALYNRLLQRHNEDKKRDLS